MVVCTVDLLGFICTPFKDPVWAPFSVTLGIDWTPSQITQCLDQFALNTWKTYQSQCSTVPISLMFVVSIKCVFIDGMTRKLQILVSFFLPIFMNGKAFGTLGGSKLTR